MFSRRMDSQSDPKTNDAAEEARGAEFAWKVHAAQDSWTAKVDTKASIILAVEVAVLGVLLALHSTGRALEQLSGWRAALDFSGLALHILAVFLAVSAVIPMLRVRKARAEAKDNIIYFGHLRHWNRKALIDRLGSLSPHDEIEQLSQQLLAMSKLNWRKHRLLQGAIFTAVVGSAVIGVAIAWP